MGALAVILLVLGLTTPAFYTTANLLNVGQVAAILGVVTLGQALVMLGGGFDLSVGAMAGLAFLTITTITEGQDAAIPRALLIVVGFALLVGLINSVLVVARAIPPFVATLGTSILIAGFMTAWSQGVFPGSVPDLLRRVSASHAGFVSVSLALFLLLAGLVALLLRYTTFGQHLYATGLNVEAARYSGVRVGRVISCTYLLSALLAAFAGVLLASYTGFADATAGKTLHLESIAAAVIGGIGLFGGRGRAINAVIGAVLMTVVLNIGVLNALPSESQPILTGLVLLAGAAVYGVRGRSKR